MNKYIFRTFLILFTILSGCAAPPINYAPVDKDSGAKDFTPPVGKASLYIYRNENFGFLVPMPVTLNNKSLGETGGKTYFRINLPPGNHTISGQAENLSIADISAEAGKNYFIWQEVKMGVWKARNELKQVAEAVGRSGVLESKLLRSLVSDNEFDKADENKSDALALGKAGNVVTGFSQQLPQVIQSESITTFNSSSNRRALVIGNDTYKSVSKLLNAREDARAIAANLSSVGYQVTLKIDLNEKEMKAALRAFSNQVQGGDEVLFYFAGHGVQLGSTNYLLPTDIIGDSEAQVRDEAVQLQRILDDMSERKAKFTLAMIDACRDNPFKNSGRAIGGRGLAPTTAASGQMVIFSAGTGQQALDKLSNSDKDRNGLFTRVFIQEMQKPNQTIDRVVKNVRNQVAELAKSVGHEQVPAIYDQVLGDFYFKR